MQKGSLVKGGPVNFDSVISGSLAHRSYRMEAKQRSTGMKSTRRNYEAEFKVKGTVEALRGDKPFTESSENFTAEATSVSGTSE